MEGGPNKEEGGLACILMDERWEVPCARKLRA